MRIPKGVAPHILLISVSIVVSVGRPPLRGASIVKGVERNHPSSCPPFHPLRGGGRRSTSNTPPARPG